MLTSKTGKLTVQHGCIQGSPSTCIGRSLLVLEPPNQRNNSETLRAGESSSLPTHREKHEAHTCSLRKGSLRPGELSKNNLLRISGTGLGRSGTGLQICVLTVTIWISLGSVFRLHFEKLMGTSKATAPGKLASKHGGSTAEQSSNRQRGKWIVPGSALE